MSINNRATALYCRLSKDDALLGESMSIKMQKIILEKFALEHNYYKYEFYIDDGYSGVNFERPDFKRMIRDIENGLIERVIVKDLSRFGRNYILIGEYVELTFPRFNVQFISIAENMDSFKGNLDMLPFNNLMNEWYARDISKKQRASVKAKGMNGKRLTTKAIYGYTVNPAEKSEWIIDEKTAEIVRKIFDMFINGNGIAMIAKYLTDSKIPTPSGNETDTHAWSRSTVKSILSKQEYCGDTVNFRTERVSYKSKKIKINSPEDWAVFQDTHPAIITREMYQQAQEILGTHRRVISEHKKKPVVLFNGVLFCADCGNRMYIMRKKGVHLNSDAYICSNNRKSKKSCSSHYIKEEELKQIISDDIQRIIRYYSLDEVAFRNKLICMIKKRFATEYSTATERIKTIEKRLDEIPNIRKNLYEEKLNGQIDGIAFSDIMLSFDDEANRLKEERENLLAFLKETQENVMGADLFLNRLKLHLNDDSIDRTFIDDMIERIEVYEAEQTENKYLKIPKVCIIYVGIGRIEGIF